MTVRERFEAWAELRWHPDARGPLERDERGGYYNTAIEYAWRAYLAATEAAARVYPSCPDYERIVNASLDRGSFCFAMTDVVALAEGAFGDGVAKTQAAIRAHAGEEGA